MIRRDFPAERNGRKDDKAAEEKFWTANASKEELHSFVMNDMDGFHPVFTEILRSSPVDGILHPPILMRDMTPPKLPRGRVTLLGDAAHPMVPCMLLLTLAYSYPPY